MNSKVDCIKAIDINTVHKICSDQVVLSLAVAVKELIENSIDAGATIIDVRLKNYGIDLIEVSDNGSGVKEENFQALTLKYHTSKLTEYSELLEVGSLGFRGEALSSLCSLANVTITTRHVTSDYATKIEYDNKGHIFKQSLCSRQVGTTVTVSNLFCSLPVRQKEFHKNAKREFNKMTQMLNAYCLISVGVKITCSHQTGSNTKTIVLATQGSNLYKDNITCIFGHKQLQSLVEIKAQNITNIKENIMKGLSGTVNDTDETVELEDIEIDLSEDSNDNEKITDKSSSPDCSKKSQGYRNLINPIQLNGFISSCAHGSGRSTTDRQFYYINSRPCEPTKVMKLVNEIYRQFNPNQYPFIFLNIELDRTLVDVNLTPDKRKVFLSKEKSILVTIKNSLLKMFENVPRTLKVEPSSNIYNRTTDQTLKPDVDQPRLFNAFLQQFGKNSSADKVTGENKNNEKVPDLKRKSTILIDSYVVTKSKKVEDLLLNTETSVASTSHNISFKEEEKTHKEFNNEQYEIITVLDNFEKLAKSEESTKGDDKFHLEEFKNEHDELIPTQDNFEAISTSNKAIKGEDIEKNVIYLEYTSQLPNTQIRNLSDFVLEKSHTIYCKNKSSAKVNISKSNKEKPAKCVTINDKEYLGKHKKRFVNMKTSLEHVKTLTNIFNKRDENKRIERIKFKSLINPVHNKKCEEELTREISKDQFKEMAVIGQFNLGFIITRLEDDLFIIDQHATDEIYNFETLQKTTELTSQKLVVPQQLELTSVNEQILIDNIGVFKQNGFSFDINEDAPATKKVKLLTIPMSRNWIFGKEDIDELLFMLSEHPSEDCRPSRVRDMFASRACRKSVMIGTALSKACMKKLVDHMAEIDKPWNCPHGRPTIRHLVNLAMMKTSAEDIEN